MFPLPGYVPIFSAPVFSTCSAGFPTHGFPTGCLSWFRHGLRGFYRLPMVYHGFPLIVCHGFAIGFCIAFIGFPWFPMVSHRVFVLDSPQVVACFLQVSPGFPWFPTGCLSCLRHGFVHGFSWFRHRFLHSFDRCPVVPMVSHRVFVLDSPRVVAFFLQVSHGFSWFRHRF